MQKLHFYILKNMQNFLILEFIKRLFFSFASTNRMKILNGVNNAGATI